jgi:hypothetical protein
LQGLMIALIVATSLSVGCNMCLPWAYIIGFYKKNAYSKRKKFTSQFVRIQKTFEIFELRYYILLLG